MSGEPVERKRFWTPLRVGLLFLVLLALCCAMCGLGLNMIMWHTTKESREAVQRNPLLAERLGAVELSYEFFASQETPGTFVFTVEGERGTGTVEVVFHDDRTISHGVLTLQTGEVVELPLGSVKREAPSPDVREGP